MKNSLSMWCCVALVWMAACHPSSGQVPLPLVYTPVTVTGRVVDSLGMPNPKALVVLVNGDRPPQAVDGQGAFTFTDVTPPYDLAILVDKTRTSGPVFLYQGLTRADPSVSVFDNNPIGVFVPVSRAQFSGTLSGGETPLTNTNPMSYVVTEAGSGSFGLDFKDANPSYDSTAYWEGTGPETVSVYALQRILATPASTIPLRYAGFGRRENISLRDGDSLLRQDVVLSPVSNSTLEGAVVLPEGDMLDSLVVDIRFQPGTISAILLSDSAAGSSFRYAVPVIEGSSLSLQLSTRARDPSDRARTIYFLDEVTPGRPLGPLKLPAPPRLLVPANGATSVTSRTDLSWSDFPGVFTLELFSPDPSSPFFLEIVTRSHHVSLPDLSALGVSWPVKTSLSWSVKGDAEKDSVDEVADPAQKPRAFGRGRAGYSGGRSFTTADAP